MSLNTHLKKFDRVFDRIGDKIGMSRVPISLGHIEILQQILTLKVAMVCMKQSAHKIKK